MSNQLPKFSVIERIAAHAACAPESLAVAADSENLTYAELDLRSNQLAQHLQSLGVGTDSVVGILLERSIASVIGVLAVLKVGAAFLPLDPSTPPDRLAFTLRDAEVSVAITRESLADRLMSVFRKLIRVDADREEIA